MTSYIQQLGDLERTSGASSNDYLLLADQAALLMRRVPATAVEYILVAEAYSVASEYGLAEQMFAEAERRAQTLVELVTIRRGMGLLRLNSGDSDWGREHFQRALRTMEASEYRDAPTSVRNQLGFDTEMLWSDAELRQQHCRAAREHLERAEAYRSTGGIIRAPNDLDAYAKRLASCKEATSP